MEDGKISNVFSTEKISVCVLNLDTEIKEEFKTIHEPDIVSDTKLREYLKEFNINEE